MSEKTEKMEIIKMNKGKKNESKNIRNYQIRLIKNNRIV